MREISDGFFVICDECKAVPFRKSDRKHVEIRRDGLFLRLRLRLRKLRKSLSTFRAWVWVKESADV